MFHGDVLLSLRFKKNVSIGFLLPGVTRIQTSQMSRFRYRDSRLPKILESSHFGGASWLGFVDPTCHVLNQIIVRVSRL